MAHGEMPLNSGGVNDNNIVRTGGDRNNSKYCIVDSRWKVAIRPQILLAPMCSRAGSWLGLSQRLLILSAVYGININTTIC